MFEASRPSPQSPAISAALRVAERAAADRAAWRQQSSGVPTRWVAVGDPQAPIERYFEVLTARGVLGSDGWLEPDVRLVSMGDHFDFGSFEQRRTSADSSLRLLSWLAAHAPDQVTLLLGNHDLARVGELAGFNASEFDAASSAAHELYREPTLDAARERAFLERYPALPSVEAAARDLSSFRVEQRELVAELLISGRFQLAVASPHAVACHAGVTREHLTAIGLPVSRQSNAPDVANALNASLQAAVNQWRSTPQRPLTIPGLHRVGSAGAGEAGGVLLHRAAHPRELQTEERAAPPDLYSRRFDPRRLPRGLVQVVGHVHDAKCRRLLHDWVVDTPSRPGALRNLIVQGESVV